MTKQASLTLPIDASVWFSPGEPPQRRSTASTSSVHERLAATVRKRAQSASAILGRRHFEIEKQDVSVDEVLRGRHLLSMSSNSIAVTVPQESGNRSHETKCCSAQNQQSRTFKTLRIRRPRTSPGIRSCGPPPPTDKTDLVIKAISIHGVKRSETSESENSASESETAAASPTALQTFRSDSDMKKAYNTRIKSAPASITTSVPNTAAGSDCDRSRTPLFWRTRNSFQNKPSTSRPPSSAGLEWEPRSGSRGSSLRYLLQRDHSDLGHGPSCPYKCRGCFRACLASDNYLETQASQGTPESKQPLSLRERQRKLMTIALGRSQPMYKALKRR